MAIDVITAGTSTGATVSSIPSNALSADQCEVLVMSLAAGITVSAVPTGWSLVWTCGGTVFTNPVRVYLGYGGASGISAGTFTFSASGWVAYTWERYTGSDGTYVLGAVNTSTATSPSVSHAGAHSAQITGTRDKGGVLTIGGIKAPSTSQFAMSNETCTNGDYTWTITTDDFASVSVAGHGKPVLLTVADQGPLTFEPPGTVKAPQQWDHVMSWTTRNTSGTAISNNGYEIRYIYLNRIKSLPFTPSDLSPANNAAQGLAAGATFQWRYADPHADPQSGFAFRRKISGAGTYEYYNVAAGTWGASAVINPLVATSGSTVSYTFPSGKWTNGQVYNWSVATADNQDTASLSPFAADNTITAGSPPTVTVTAPAGNVSTNRPTVTWSYSDPDSDPQATYHVKVFSAAQYGAGGFDPATSTPTHTSGLVASAAASYLVTSDLLTDVTYRAYVQVGQSGSHVSAWQYSEFVPVVGPPANPIISLVSPDPSNGRMSITVQARDNLLTTNQADAETDATGMTGVNSTVARTTAVAQAGAGAWQMTASTAAAAEITTPTGASGFPVVGSTVYQVLSQARSAVTSRTPTISVVWYTAAGAVISTSTQNGSATSTSAWVTNNASFTSPATAAFAALKVGVTTAAASEVHYFDSLSLAPGTSTTWTRGGLVNLGKLVLERSLDNATWSEVRGARDADNLPVIYPSQITVVQDYEAPLAGTVYYRAKIKVDV